MPSFVSKQGLWDAAHERVAYVDKEGQPQIYDGPDRAALEFIQKEGGTVGQDALQDPQLLQASRNAGFNTLAEYLAHFAPRPKEVEAINKAHGEVVTHKLPQSKPMTNAIGTKGGFNSDDETPLQAMEKKKG